MLSEMTRALLSAVVVWWLVQCADARYYYNEINVMYNTHEASSDLLTSRGFGFLKLGSVSFHLSCPTHHEGVPSFWLLFCSVGDERQFSRMATPQLNFDCVRLNDVNKDDYPTDAFCRRVRVERQRLPDSAGQNTTQATSKRDVYYFSRTIKMDYFYKFVLFKCPKSLQKNQDNRTEIWVETCDANLQLMNPGDKHLSSDELPVPLIYAIVGFIWSVTIAAWFINTVIYHRYSNRLHKIITCGPLAKCLLIVIILVRWDVIATTGRESVALLGGQQFLKSVADSMLFVTMMIISSGYGLVDAQLKHFRWTSLGLVFFVFAVSLMCVSWVHTYFLAFSVCCVVFMTYKTIKWCSHNIEFLGRRRRRMQRFVVRNGIHFRSRCTVDDQLYHKHKTLTRFRMVCAGFSMVYAIVVTLATFLTEYTYIKVVTYELPQLFIYLTIGYLYRLRNFDKFEHIEVVSQRDDHVVLFLPECSRDTVDPCVVLGHPLDQNNDTKDQHQQ